MPASICPRPVPERSPRYTLSIDIRPIVGSPTPSSFCGPIFTSNSPAACVAMRVILYWAHETRRLVDRVRAVGRCLRAAAAVGGDGGYADGEGPHRAHRTGVRSRDAADDAGARPVVRIVPRARQLRERRQPAQAGGTAHDRNDQDAERAVLPGLQAAGRAVTPRPRHLLHLPPG